ncbi:penicillin-binding protein [Desertibacillus haloalkaliphilus]|nr:penicillin-binding protein [Desertibacillus haloalkaliphilus]
MRITTGLFIILLLFICFLLLLTQVITETGHTKPIHEAIDEQISVDHIALPTNSYIYDQHGTLISEIYQAENRIPLAYDKMPTHVIDAFIATEDRNFYDHKGFDLTAIVRALMINIENNSIEQGASTITQQLVRNVFLSHEQSYNRKLSELLYAYQFEQHYDKEEIIALYINTIYFQHGVYGIEAASRYYFGRSTDELSLAEIAFLSAIPNNPTYYNPLTNKDKTKERQHWILQKMIEVEAITEEEYELALVEPIQLEVTKKTDHYPDYVTYIHHEFTELVATQDGYADRLRTADASARESIRHELDQKVESLYREGIIIETALNPMIQEQTIETISNQLPESDVEGVGIVIDHTTNEIVAITGGKQYNKFDFHRAYQATRQPGSAIKPLLVFAPYLAESNASIHSSINANNLCIESYCPKNYGGGQYGTVTIETALKHSYNTAAVRLLMRTGIETSFQYIDDLRFEHLHQSDYHLPAALGGLTYGVTPLELTNAYTTFANEGKFQPAKGIRQVTDLDGNILYQWEETSTQVWDQATNTKMRTLLHKVVTEGTGKKAYLAHSYIGGKTGTTNNYHDAWFIGLTDRYTTGVWVGKDQPQSLGNVYQRSPHLLIWRDVMSAIH